MTDKRQKKYKGQKIYTYVSQSDMMRLQAIVKTYGLKSIYKLQKYLVDCFLRVVDPNNDTNNDPVPAQIEEMFIHPKEYLRIQSACKKNKRHSIQLLIPFGEFKTNAVRRLEIDNISDEIIDMFESSTDWESQPTRATSNYSGMTVKRKPDQRKYKTPDDLNK